jgi:hypothetical protein
MFAEYEKIAIDECYSTVDHAFRYTLVHLKTKKRDTALHKFMVFCSEKYGIVKQNIFGYDSVSANSTSSELYVHPAFLRLVTDKLECRPCFSLWVETPGIRPGGGILETYARRMCLMSASEKRINQDHISGSAHAEEDAAYDVVKKRKAMDAEPQSNEDESADAMAMFEEFERSVLTALATFRDDEEANRKREMVELEDSIAQGVIPKQSGGVYFAWSDCLRCMKIGATRREDPMIRLQELSRHVTSPFVLRAWLPTPTPFRLEAQAHAHFSSKRLRGERGVGTEFFLVTDAEVDGWVAVMAGVVSAR